MRHKKMIFLNYILTFVLLFTSLAAQSTQEVDMPETFTNLFEDNENETESAIRKRSSSSVLESGVKFGTKIGYNYIFKNNPNIANTFFLDIPFAKRFTAVVEVGAQTINITNHTFSTTNAYRTKKNIVGKGEKNYLAIAGQFKYYIKSVHIGLGVNFYKFLYGSVTDISSMTAEGGTKYDISATRTQNDFYAAVSVGYLAELRPNIFLTPEFNTFVNLPPGDTIVILNVGIGLSFKL